MSTQPVERLRATVVTTPAGTSSATPQHTTWVVGQGVVARVVIVIPPGHAGLTGLEIWWGGRTVFPYVAGEWIAGDNDEIPVELELYVTDHLEVVTYNTGIYSHQHLLRAYMRDLEAAALDLFAPVAGIPPGPPPEEELTDAEFDAIVTAVGDAFMAQLQAAFDAFLADLQATLGGGGLPPPGGGGGPPPPTLVMVPNVTGLLVDDAGPALTALGLAWTESDVAGTQLAGTVVAQEPAAGSQVDPTTTTVALTVSQGPPPPPATVIVPNVVGMQQTPGAQALRAVGLLVSVATKVNKSVPRFQVLSQSPKAGTSVQTGSTVTITVAKWQ